MRRSEYLNRSGWRKPGGKSETFFPEKENFLEDQQEIEFEFLQKLNKDFENRKSQCMKR